MTSDERKRVLRAEVKAKVDAYRLAHEGRPWVEVKHYRERITWDLIDRLVDEVAAFTPESIARIIGNYLDHLHYPIQDIQAIQQIIVDRSNQELK